MTALAGQLAVVTGTSRGIGAATADALHAQGARIVGLARTIAAKEGDRRWDIPCDLTHPEDLTRAVDQVLERWGPPNILVSNAGGFLLQSFEQTTPGDLEAQLAINLRAPFALAAAVVPAMREASGGLVVHLGSVADHSGFPQNAAYASSKFGLRGLHETLVAEYRGTPVRFSLISPGPTDTAAWDPVDPDHREGFLPRAKMLRPSDVADAVVFVATRPPRVHIEWLRLGPA